ncbi:lecithin retinol acyltransferase family protein [Nevskia soli]|uniref:lecithin retinol acyltransferase family protein n=1 Tax=Nevskia soli TaxID=418856 RepID=UPI0009FCB240|nr:lecithin retinol acyltransferase family protein [Nevskia soli]
MFIAMVEVLSVRWWGCFNHTGLKVTFADGSTLVYANVPGRGVIRQSLAEFAMGRSMVTAHGISGHSAFQVIARAERALGTPYRLFNWNCEHFVSWALGREPNSPQLHAAGGALLATLILAQLTAS